MLVRRYQGRNEEEVIAKAKAELGPEAIILHVKQLSKNGIFDLKSAPKVEIIVALDQDLNEFRKTKSSVNEVNTQEDEGSALNRRQKVVCSPTQGKSGFNHNLPKNRTADNKAESRRQKADCLLPTAYCLLPTASEASRSHGMAGRTTPASIGSPVLQSGQADMRLGAVAQELYRHLLSHEVQEEVAQKLSLSIQELLSGDSSLSLREAMNVCIEELIRTSGGLNIAQKPSVVAFIGPTGVGKTTTIAKLAAHYHLRENQRISLITVDTYRIAAIEQLKTYATYIGIPLEVALTPQEMHQLVRKHKNCDLILIDTPGRSQKDSLRIQELRMILSAASPQEVHLLLNVTAQHRVLLDIVRGFKVLSPNRVLFTKLDESACFGHILNFSVALGKPVSYLTTGQDVPDDIQLATIERITEYLLREGDVLA